MSDEDRRTGGAMRHIEGFIPHDDGCVFPDMTKWLATLPNGSITVSFGDQDLPEHVGKPVTNEAGERIGTITKAMLTQDGDVKVEMRFDE